MLIVLFFVIFMIYYFAFSPNITLSVEECSMLTLISSAFIIRIINIYLIDFNLLIKYKYILILPFPPF